MLLGGGRNLDRETEKTSDPGLNDKIQKALECFLAEKILPGKPFSIERRWAGIMGMGTLKKPIIEFVSPNVLAAVRMGGMGVAIGSLVGSRAADLLKTRT